MADPPHEDPGYCGIDDPWCEGGTSGGGPSFMEICVYYYASGRTVCEAV